MSLLINIVLTFALLYIPVIAERKNKEHPHSWTVYTLIAVWMFLFQVAIRIL